MKTSPDALDQQKWELKRINCPLHPTTPNSIKGFFDDLAGYRKERCINYDQICAFDSCPFVYWGCFNE